jgi:hypothetical protein
MEYYKDMGIMARQRFERLLAWARRNERWLSAAFFVFGFFDHLITFGAFSLHTEIIIFEVYLAFIALCTLLSHVTLGREGRLRRAVAVLAPLAAQMALGGILAGFVVFYGKESVLSVSWPFLVFLSIIFVGSELFRDYREHLVFQTSLFYFSLYALAIFALPTYVGTLSERTFLLSTALAAVLFAFYLFILALFGWQRLRQTLLPILASAGVMTGAVVLAYVTDVIPPLPLALHDGGIYHSIEHQGDAYIAQGEAKEPWWHIGPEVVHHVAGTPLYAFSAVAAPGAFATSVIHEWQYKNEQTGEWETRSTVAFTESGGRKDGYRGYSLKGDPEAGKWRVRVMTLTGQTIGELRFDVAAVPSGAPLTEERL